MKKIGIIICFIITAIAAAGIFIYGYQYADWFDENNEENDNDNGDSSVTPNPTPSPNLSPDYEFMQCTASSGTPCCNGLSSNCDKRVNEIAFAMSHNSMSTVEDGFLFANHLYDLGRSLEDGFRGLMLDLCSCDGKPTFCHANCSLGTKDVSETFEEIISFLEKHPSEVIILEFQVEDDGDIFSMYEIMKSIDGFVDRIYVHDIFSDVWPRLSTLVESDKRILLFQHDGPNCNVDGACPEGFHNTYTYMFETSFEIKEVDDLLDSSSCAVTRGTQNNDFFILNHFLYRFPPSYDDSSELNKLTNIQQRSNQCKSTNNGKNVNLVSVNHWSSGDMIEFVQEHNKAL